MKTDLTDISVVLDRSGSMESVRKDTIGGFNAFLEEQQAQPGEATLTLAQFDDQYEIMHDGKRIKDVPALTEQTFVPRGMTALLDAIGRTIVATGARLAAMSEADRPAKVIFVILTDGEENHSREFDLAKVTEMIEHQRKVYSWDFVFLGANQDAIKAAAGLGINRGHALNYVANSQGTCCAFSAMSRGLSSYRSGNQSVVDSYFSDEDRQKQAAAQSQT